jgi:hypothetical protein
VSCLYPPSISWHSSSLPGFGLGELYYLRDYKSGIFVLGIVSRGPYSTVYLRFRFYGSEGGNCDLLTDRDSDLILQLKESFGSK